MKNISNKSRRLLAVAVALIMVMGACFTGAFTALAETVDVSALAENVGHVATLSEFGNHNSATNYITENSYGIHYERAGSSAYSPAPLTTSLGAWGNGFKLQFANYNRCNTNGDYGKFLITIGSGVNHANYLFWRTISSTLGHLGIVIDTVNGQLQFKKTYAQDNNADYCDTYVLAESEALLYDNFKEKAFSVEFKANGTGNGTKNMDVIVEVDGTKVVGKLDYTLMSAPSHDVSMLCPSGNTYISFSALKNDNSGCAVDFIGYTLGTTPTYVDSTQTLVTTSDNGYTPGNVSTNISGGGVALKHSGGQGGWYPFALNTNLGGFPTKGVTLQFANLASTDDGGKLFAIGLSNAVVNSKARAFAIGRDQAPSTKVSRPAIVINTLDGKVQMWKCIGALEERTNAGSKSVIAQDNIIVDDALLYSNFTGKAFSVTFTDGEGCIVVKLKVGDTVLTGNISKSILATAPSDAEGYDCAGGYQYPETNAYFDFGTPTRWGSFTADFIGYSTGAVPSYADGTVEHVVTPSDNCLTASRDLVSGGTKYFATDLTYGTHIDVTPWGQAGWYPYCLGDNLGAFPSNGLALQFANFTLANPANNASFLVAFSPDRATAYNFNNQKFCYWDSTYQRPGIAVDTAKGEVQLVKSLGVLVEGNTDRGDWEISSVLIQDDAFLYENFTGKSFRFEFTPSGNNSINLKVIVADEAFTAEIPMSDFTSAPAGQKAGGTYKYPTTNTYIDIGTCERFGSTVVDFIGYSTGLTPAYADGTVDTHASKATNARSSSNNFMTNVGDYGVNINLTTQAGWYPYVYDQNLGAFPGNGIALQFANFTSDQDARSAFVVALGTVGAHGSDALLDQFRFASDYAYYQRPGIAINTIEGKVQLIKSNGNKLDPNDVNSGSDYEVTKTLITDDAFKYANFTGKAFRFEFAKSDRAAGEVRLDVTVGNQTFTGYFTQEELTAAPANLKAGGTYRYPTTATYVDIGSANRFGVISVDFIGSSTGFATANYDLGDNIFGADSQAVDYGNSTYFSYTALDKGMRISYETISAYYPYVIKQNFGSFPLDATLILDNYVSTSTASTARGYRQFVIGFAGSSSDDTYYKFKTGVGALLFDTVEGTVKFVVSTHGGMIEHDVIKTVLSDNILKYDAINGRKIEIGMAGRASGAMDLTVKVGNTLLAGEISAADFAQCAKIPTSATYLTVGGIDNDSSIYNEWSIDLLAYKDGVETTPETSKNDVKCAFAAEYYDVGTLGIESNIAAVAGEVEGAVVEYGTIFFTKKMLGNADLVIGYTNAKGQSVTAVSKTLGVGDPVPDSFVAVLKEKTSLAGSGTVSRGYYSTTFVARPYVKYYDSTSGTYKYIYGNKVEMKGADMFSNIDYMIPSI